MPSNLNKSTLFYSSELSVEKIVHRLQPENILKESGLIIRKAIQKVDFDLEDKFYDESTLKNSWETLYMPNEVLTFLSSLIFQRKIF